MAHKSTHSHTHTCRHISSHMNIINNATQWHSIECLRVSKQWASLWNCMCVCLLRFSYSFVKHDFFFFCSVLCFHRVIKKKKCALSRKKGLRLYFWCEMNDKPIFLVALLFDDWFVYSGNCNRNHFNGWHISNSTFKLGAVGHILQRTIYGELNFPVPDVHNVIKLEPMCISSAFYYIELPTFIAHFHTYTQIHKFANFHLLN